VLPARATAPTVVPATAAPVQRVLPARAAAQRVMPAAAAPVQRVALARAASQRVVPTTASSQRLAPAAPAPHSVVPAVASPQYQVPVSDTILSFAATKRALQGKTYLDDEDGQWYTVRNVRSYGREGYLVADIFPVGKPLCNNLAPIYVAEVYRMLESTPPFPSHLVAAVTTVPCSVSNRFEALSDRGPLREPRRRRRRSSHSSASH
jgi:hypothetical protein